MPKLSNLLAEKAKGEVQVGGSTLAIVFYVMRRERFSDEEWTALLALNGRDYLKTLLPRVLISWDLENGDGQQIPVSAEAIDEHNIPDALLFAIERRVFGSDLAGKVLTLNNSPGQ